MFHFLLRTNVSRGKDITGSAVMRDRTNETLETKTVLQRLIKNKFSLRNHKENYQRTIFPNIIFLRQ